MKKYLLLTLIVSVSLLSLGTLAILHNVNLTVAALNQSILTTQQDIQETREEIHGTSQNLNALLIQAGLTADEVRRASIEQKKYWAQNSKATGKVLRDLDQTVLSLNTQIEDIGASAQIELDTLTSATEEVALVGGDLDTSVKQAGELLEKLDQPLTVTAVNLAQTSQNVNRATDSLVTASKDIEKKVHELVKPASFAKRVGLTILDVGYKLRLFLGL